MRNLELEFQVVGGTGTVVPFVTTTDNGTGDTILRTQ
jgi:hypothetical protein